MALQNTNPTTTAAWQKLKENYNNTKDLKVKDLFKDDENRAKKLTIEDKDFLFDYSKHRITEDTVKHLLELANEVNLKDAIKSYFKGEPINQTEGRAVLHTALRAKESDSVLVDGENIIPEI